MRLIRLTIVFKTDHEKMKITYLARKLLLAFLIWTPMQSHSQSIQEKFESFQERFPQEKVYLHLSKPNYRLGEKIWFKAYLVDGSTHRAATTSTVVRVELLDPHGKVLETKLLSTMHKRMSGDFVLDISYPPGPYTVRAYTNWMRNFENDYLFSTTIDVFKGNGLETFQRIDSTRSDLSLAFFPEGGDIIANTTNVIAIKAVGKSGEGLRVQGIVLDDAENQVAAFNTNDYGFAKFDLTPKVGVGYHAKIFSLGNDYLFDLPEAISNGIKVAITNEFESRTIAINLAAFGTELTNCSLLVHQRGIIHSISKITTPSSTFTYDLEKSQLSPGIFHLTLFDPNNLPVAERVFAINLNADPINAALKRDSIYQVNSAAKLKFEVIGSDERDINGSFSASVTKENGIYYSLDGNIENYLLLSSDLTGTIENPSHYFNNSQNAHQDLDLLMMTQGWKRFTWNEVLSDSLKKVAYQAEKNGITLRGHLVDFYNRSKRREGIIALSSFASAKLQINTTPDGSFRIPSINFVDSKDIVLKGERFVNKKGKTRDDVFISIRNMGRPAIPKYPALADLSTTSEEVTSPFADTTGFTLLEEVVVSGIKDVKNLKDPFAKARNLYSNPSVRIIADSVIANRVGVKNVSGYFLGLPGVAIIGSGPSTKVRLQGLGGQKRLTPTEQNTTPLFMIDGVPTNEATFFSLNPYDIYYIDILKGTKASVYGTRGSNGVFFAYLRPAEQAKTTARPGSVLYQFPGYHRAEQFTFTDIMQKNLAKDPLGVTVYWEPSLEVKMGTGRI